MSKNIGEGPGRREARERAIGLLYEAEAKGVEPAEIIESLPAPPMPYAVALANGVAEHAEEIQKLIETHAEGWSLARMPAVDRAVLRLAVFELVYRADVPKGVVMDEAIEIAKEYSTEASGKFVNGVLAAIADVVRPS